MAVRNGRSIMFAKFFGSLLALLGVVCGALTLFSSLRTVLSLDHRVHELAVRWVDWTQAVWVWLEGLFRIQKRQVGWSAL